MRTFGARGVTMGVCRVELVAGGWLWEAGGVMCILHEAGEAVRILYM